MKKITTTILLFSIIIKGFSQSISMLDLNSNLVSGTMVNAYILPNSTRTDEFLAHNAGGTTNEYKVLRTIFYEDAGDATQFCWGGSCYGFAINTSSYGDSIAAGATINFGQGGFHCVFNSGSAMVTRYVHYQVYNTNISSHGDTTGFTIKYIASLTGIDEQQMAGTIADVFPNPASGVVSVNYNLTSAAQLSKIAIYDMLGKEVKEIKLTDKQGVAKLNTDDLVSGIYFYSLVMDNKVITTKKLVINK